MLGKRRVTAIWLGLPIMRSRDQNAGAAFLNAIFAEEANKFDVMFLPLSDSFVGSDNGFAAYLPDKSGHLRQVRTNDGVHFTDYGYELIAEKVYSTIKPPRPLSTGHAGNP